MVDVDDLSNMDNVKNSIEDKVKNAKAIINVSDTVSYVTYQGEIDEGKTYVGVFSGIFLFIAMLSVITTMTRVVKNQRVQIGTLKALGFSEHGSIFEWWHKKCAIEKAGMKYIHGIEAYLTASLDEKVRDNYHCVLIARNYDGFLELNKLISASFNRNDNHFYYVPRISFDELFNTSDNILVTTACVGGVLGKGDDITQREYLGFLTKNKHRCFLEIGHHLDKKQVEYNRRLVEISQCTGIPLIAGTDTHVLDSRHNKGRTILHKQRTFILMVKTSGI